jgi:hypothetical protein
MACRAGIPNTKSKYSLQNIEVSLTISIFNTNAGGRKSVQHTGGKDQTKSVLPTLVSFLKNYICFSYAIVQCFETRTTQESQVIPRLGETENNQLDADEILQDSTDL